MPSDLQVLARAKANLTDAIATVPAHIDERLVEVNTRDVVAICTAIRDSGQATNDPEKLADLEKGSRAASGRTAYIQAESVRFLLKHLEAAPAPAPEPAPAG